MSPQKTHGERIEALEADNRQINKEFNEHLDDYCHLKTTVDGTHKLVIKLDAFLLGDDYDKELNGGFVKFIKKLAEDVKVLKKRREWLKGAWWVAGGVAGGLFTILLYHWDKIFG
jgi:hypothetical protein